MILQIISDYLSIETAYQPRRLQSADTAFSNNHNTCKCWLVKSIPYRICYVQQWNFKYTVKCARCVKRFYNPNCSFSGFDNMQGCRLTLKVWRNMLLPFHGSSNQVQVFAVVVRVRLIAQAGCHKCGKFLPLEVEGDIV